MRHGAHEQENVAPHSGVFLGKKMFDLNQTLQLPETCLASWCFLG